MKRLLAKLSLMTLPLSLAAAQDSPSVAVDIDVSRSVAVPFAQVQTEARQLIALLPDGAYCVLLTIGTTIRKPFAGVINPARRAEAMHQIDVLRPTERYTDLGAGLEVALAALSEVKGKPQIYLYSDGGNDPAHGSRFHGRSFQSILDTASIPDGITVFVRLFGTNAALSSSRSQVQVLRSAPDYAALVRPQPPMPSRPIPESHAQHVNPWWIGAAITVIASFVAAGLLWPRNRRNEDADLTGPLDPLPVAMPADPVRHEYRRFAVHPSGCQVSWVDPYSSPSLVIGDSSLSDIVLSECDRGAVRFSVDTSAVDAQLQIENVGSEPVFIGRRRIQPGVAQSLPALSLEMRIGRQILSVFPDIAVISEETTREAH